MYRGKKKKKEVCQLQFISSCHLRTPSLPTCYPLTISVTACLIPSEDALNWTSRNLYWLPSELRKWDYKLLQSLVFSTEMPLIKYLIACTMVLIWGTRLHHHLLKWDTTVWLNWTILKTKRLTQWDGEISLSFWTVDLLENFQRQNWRCSEQASSRCATLACGLLWAKGNQNSAD